MTKNKKYDDKVVKILSNHFENHGTFKTFSVSKFILDLNLNRSSFYKNNKILDIKCPANTIFVWLLNRFIEGMKADFYTDKVKMVDYIFIFINKYKFQLKIVTRESTVDKVEYSINIFSAYVEKYINHSKDLRKKIISKDEILLKSFYLYAIIYFIVRSEEQEDLKKVAEHFIDLL